MECLILGNSLTYHLEVRGARTASILELDWKGVQSYLLDNSESLYVYIIVGPVRLP